MPAAQLEVGKRAFIVVQKRDARGFKQTSSQEPLAGSQEPKRSQEQDPVFLGTIAPFLGIAKGFPGAFWFLGTNWPFLGIWPHSLKFIEVSCDRARCGHCPWKEEYSRLLFDQAQLILYSTRIIIRRPLKLVGYSTLSITVKCNQVLRKKPAGVTALCPVCLLTTNIYRSTSAPTLHPYPPQIWCCRVPLQRLLHRRQQPRSPNHPTNPDPPVPRIRPLHHPRTFSFSIAPPLPSTQSQCKTSA